MHQRSPNSHADGRGYYLRCQPTHWERLGVQCLAHGHFDTWRGGVGIKLAPFRLLNDSSTSCTTIPKQSSALSGVKTHITSVGGQKPHRDVHPVTCQMTTASHLPQLRHAGQGVCVRVCV